MLRFSVLHTHSHVAGLEKKQQLFICVFCTFFIIMEKEQATNKPTLPPGGQYVLLHDYIQYVQNMKEACQESTIECVQAKYFFKRMYHIKLSHCVNYRL